MGFHYQIGNMKGIPVNFIDEILLTLTMICRTALLFFLIILWLIETIAFVWLCV